MKNSLYLLSFLLVFSCTYAQQTLNQTITHDGLTRAYTLYIPANYTGQKDVPLILNFHGYTSNAFQQMNYGDFRPIADTAGFLIVHPQGTRDNTLTTHFNVGWGTSTVDDIGFVDALLDSLDAAYAIDTLRIYSTGMSNGGFMSFGLACFLSERIAAIASVTGSMSPPHFDSCNPQRPVPIMQIHGTSDGVVNYNGAAFSKPVSDVISYWVNFNQCQSNPSFASLPNTVTLDGSTVDHFVYGGGQSGSSVEHYKVINGGHTWPGTAIVSVGTNYDMDASAEIWRFFSQYDLNGLQGGTATSLTLEESSSFGFFPNPFTHTLNIQTSAKQNQSYQILALNGQLMKAGMLEQGMTSIDLSGLLPSLYVLKVDGQSFKIVKKQ